MEKAEQNLLQYKKENNLTDIGNTVLVVEHDEMIIRSADYVIDVGLAAGVHGGEIVVCQDCHHFGHILRHKLVLQRGRHQSQ